MDRMALIKQAYEEIPFYQNRIKVKDFSNLKELPLLEKEDIIDNSTRIMPQNICHCFLRIS